MTFVKKTISEVVVKSSVHPVDMEGAGLVYNLLNRSLGMNSFTHMTHSVATVDDVDWR